MFPISQTFSIAYKLMFYNIVIQILKYIIFPNYKPMASSISCIELKNTIFTFPMETLYLIACQIRYPFLFMKTSMLLLGSIFTTNITIIFTLIVIKSNTKRLLFLLYFLLFFLLFSPHLFSFISSSSFLTSHNQTKFNCQI